MVLITRFGDHFDYLELWNEPNNINDWDWRLDPEWQIFSRDDRRSRLLGPVTG